MYPWKWENIVILNSAETGSANNIQSKDSVSIRETACNNLYARVTGQWTSKQVLKSSTWSETEALSRVLKSNVDLLENKR